MPEIPDQVRDGRGAAPPSRHPARQKTVAGQSVEPPERRLRRGAAISPPRPGRSPNAERVTPCKPLPRSASGPLQPPRHARCVMLRPPHDIHQSLHPLRDGPRRHQTVRVQLAPSRAGGQRRIKRLIGIVAGPDHRVRLEQAQKRRLRRRGLARVWKCAGFRRVSPRHPDARAARFQDQPAPRQTLGQPQEMPETITPPRPHRHGHGAADLYDQRDQNRPIASQRSFGLVWHLGEKIMWAKVGRIGWGCVVVQYRCRSLARDQIGPSGKDKLIKELRDARRQVNQ